MRKIILFFVVVTFLNLGVQSQIDVTYQYNNKTYEVTKEGIKSLFYHLSNDSEWLSLYVTYGNRIPQGVLKSGVEINVIISILDEKKNIVFKTKPQNGRIFHEKTYFPKIMLIEDQVLKNLDTGNYTLKVSINASNIEHMGLIKKHKPKNLLKFVI